MVVGFFVRIDFGFQQELDLPPTNICNLSLLSTRCKITSTVSQAMTLWFSTLY